jgi:hypothetical protein
MVGEENRIEYSGEEDRTHYMYMFKDTQGGRKGNRHRGELVQSTLYTCMK